MVSEYALALDAGRATPDQLAELELLVAQGDLTVVMKDFEAGLRTPVKGSKGLLLDDCSAPF